MGDPRMTTDTAPHARRPGPRPRLAHPDRARAPPPPARCEIPVAHPAQPVPAARPVRRGGARGARREHRPARRPPAVLVTESAGGYQLIAGERRLRAVGLAGKHDHPGGRPHRRRAVAAGARPRREPPARRPQRARRGARLPAAHRRVRAHPGAGRAPRRPLARRPSPTRCACSRRPGGPGRRRGPDASAKATPAPWRPRRPRAAGRWRSASSSARPCRSARPSSWSRTARRRLHAREHRGAVPDDDPDLEHMAARLRDALGTRGHPHAGQTGRPDHHHLVRRRRPGAPVRAPDGRGAMSAQRSRRPTSVDERPAASRGTKAARGTNEYGADSIQVLEGLEAVRRRPGMYIGSTDVPRPAPPRVGDRRQLHRRGDGRPRHAHRGHASGRTAALRNADNGRGVPVGMQKQTGKDALEVVHTVLHAGGKFGGGGYKVSGGLHGVGVSVVNALSEWLRVETARDGKVWGQEYAARQARSARSGSSARRTAAAARPPCSCPTPRCSRPSSSASTPSPSACASRPT